MRRKRIFLMFTILTLSISLIAQPVVKHGQLKVEGTKLVDKDGNVTVLRGVSFGSHRLWPRFWNKDAVKWLRDDWNCDIVRAAIGVNHDNGYTSRPKWSVQKLKNVVDAAIENNIYVIIDWHSHSIMLKKAKKFFAEMAKTYGDNPHVIYEIFNEPTKQSWKNVKKYSIEVIKEIRKYDPDNIILVGTPHWSQDIHLAAENPILGFDNLMYTVHFYADSHRQWLRDSTDKAIEKGIPVFISEYGASKYDGNGIINYKQWELWIELMDKHHLSWCKWSIADKDETCSMLKPEASSNGNWTDNQIKESGLITRGLLKKYAKKK